MSSESKNIYEKLVIHFGGQVNTANALGVKQPAVSDWVRGKKNMSELIAMRAQAETKGEFKAADLCPSLNEFKQLTA